MTEKTGWPPGLLQDDCKKLSRWFASRPDARFVVRQVAAEHERDRLFRAISDPKNAALFSLGAALEAFKDVVIKEEAC